MARILQQWLAGAAAVAALGLGVGTAAGAAPPAEFTDPAGDSGTGPDITSVTASTDLGGVTFEVDIGNRPGLSTSHGELRVVVFIDSDSNPTTGRAESAGADYLLGFNGGASGLLRWDGAEFVDTGAATIAAVTPDSVLLSLVRPADARITDAFRFWVGTYDGLEDDSNWDSAPVSGTFGYALGGTTEAESTAAPAVDSLVVPPAILRPKPGMTLSARGLKVRLADDTVVAPDSLQCALKLAGKTVKSLPGGCRWRIPSAAAGQRGQLVVTAEYEGETITERYAVRIGR